MKAIPSKRPVLKEDRAFQGLTVQQENYCLARMENATQVEAYIKAFECEEEDRAKIYHRAGDLEVNPRIVARLRQLIAERSASTSLVPQLTKEFVINGLMNLALHGSTDNNKIRALELLGKTVGIDLFRDVHVTERVTRTPEDVEKQLKDRIDALISGPTIEGETTASTTDKGEPAPVRSHPRSRKQEGV